MANQIINSPHELGKGLWRAYDSGQITLDDVNEKGKEYLIKYGLDIGHLNIDEFNDNAIRQYNLQNYIKPTEPVETMPVEDNSTGFLDKAKDFIGGIGGSFIDNISNVNVPDNFMEVPDPIALTPKPIGNNDSLLNALSRYLPSDKYEDASSYDDAKTLRQEHLDIMNKNFSGSPEVEVKGNVDLGPSSIYMSSLPTKNMNKTVANSILGFNAGQLREDYVKPTDSPKEEGESFIDKIKSAFGPEPWTKEQQAEWTLNKFDEAFQNNNAEEMYKLFGFNLEELQNDRNAYEKARKDVQLYDFTQLKRWNFNKEHSSGNKVLSFLDRIGQSGASVIMGEQVPEQYKPTTENKIADTAAGVIGAVGGFATPVAGLQDTIYGAGHKIAKPLTDKITKPIVDKLDDILSRIPGDQLYKHLPQIQRTFFAKSVIPAAIESGAGVATVDAIKTISDPDYEKLPFKDKVKVVNNAFLWGALFGAAFKTAEPYMTKAWYKMNGYKEIEPSSGIYQNKNGEFIAEYETNFRTVKKRLDMFKNEVQKHWDKNFGHKYRTDMTLLEGDVAAEEAPKGALKTETKVGTSIKPSLSNEVIKGTSGIASRTYRSKLLDYPQNNTKLVTSYELEKGTETTELNGEINDEDNMSNIDNNNENTQIIKDNDNNEMIKELVEETVEETVEEIVEDTKDGINNKFKTGQIKVTNAIDSGKNTPISAANKEMLEDTIVLADEPNKTKYNKNLSKNSVIEYYGKQYKINGEEGNNYLAVDVETGKSTYIPKSLTNEFKQVNTRQDTISMEQRDYDNVRDKGITAYQYEHPEVKPYFQRRAKELIQDIKDTLKGEKYPIKDEKTGEIIDYKGNKRFTSETIGKIKDETKASYKDIEDALQRIVNDNGRENTVLAKKIELMIDDNLVNGYKTFDRIDVPANTSYINTRNKLEDKKVSVPKKVVDTDTSININQQFANQLTIPLPDEQASIFDLDQQVPQKSNISTEEKTVKNISSTEIIKPKQEIINDRDTITIERVDKEPFVVKRDNKILYFMGKEKYEGIVTGISHANNQIRVKSINSKNKDYKGQWLDKGFIYPLEVEEAIEYPKTANGETLSNIIDKVNEKKEPVEGFNEADKVIKSTIKYSTKGISDFNNRFNKGENLSLEDVKSMAEYIMNNEESIKEELSRHKNKELQKMIPAFKRNWYKKKSEMVKYIYESQLTRLYYDVADTNSISIGFGGGRTEDKVKQKINDVLDNLDDNKLKEILAKNKKYFDEALEKKKKMVEGIKNPKTLKDFEIAKKVRELTVEEQRTYEDLKALDLKNKGQVAEEKKRQKDIESLNKIVKNVKFTKLTESKNTKTGDKIFKFQLSERVGKDEFKEILKQVKKLGGSYYRQNFYFTTDNLEEAQNKLNILKEGGTYKKEVNVEGKRKNTAEKLRVLADNMQNTIDDKYSDRLANTDRRARMAASAQAEGDYLTRIQSILRSIADNIEKDNLVFLSKINARTQIESLEQLIVRARSKYINKEVKNKYPNDRTGYMQTQYRKELKSKPTTIEMIDHVEMPTMLKTHVISMLKEGQKLDGLKRDSAKLLRRVTNNKNDYIKDIDMYMDTLDKIHKKGVWDYGSVIDDIAEYKRLKVLGIESVEQLRAALREYLPYYNTEAVSKEELKLREAKAKEGELARRKIEGYFPTPKNIVRHMIKIADIQEDDKILEPSAGSGHIADEIGIGKVDVAEYNNSLRDLLDTKGHNIVGNDALEVKGQYDKIIMNPPFEKAQDIEHVMYAYENNLAPGGRLVAIMSEGPFFRNDKKATKFREWLDEIGGTSEKLPEGSFKVSDRTTGVNTRLVVIEKDSTLVKKSFKEFAATKQDEKSNSQTKAFTGEGAINAKGRRLSENKSDKPKPVRKIMKEITKNFFVPITSRRYRSRRGIAGYKVFAEVIENKIHNTIGPIIHELGHHLDKKYDFSTKDYVHIQNIVDSLPGRFKENYRDDELLGEGVAEFVRLYLTDPVAAKELGSDFYDIFEGRLNKKDLNSLQYHREDILNWLNSTVQDKVESTIKSYTEKETTDKAYKKLNAKMEFIDDLAPFEEFIKTVEKLSGRKMSARENTYLLGLHSRKSDIIARSITTEMLVDPKGNKIGDGLKSIYEKIDKDEKTAFDGYLKSVHSLDWNKQNKRVFNDDFSIDDIERQVKSYEEKYPHFKDTANQLYDWWGNFIDHWLVNTGLLEDKVWKKMRSIYPHYVPNYRVRDNYVNTKDGIKRGKRGFANQRNNVKKAKGSGRDTYSAMESFILDVDKIVKTVMRRNVMLSIHNLYNETEGLGHIIRKVSPKMLPNTFDARSLKAKLLASLTQDHVEKLPESERLKLDGMDLSEAIDYLHDNDFETPDIVNDVINDTITYFTPETYSNETDIVTVIDEKGKTHFYEIFDPLFLEALANLSDRNLDPYVKLMGEVKRTLTVLITGGNPIFGITSNVWRDTPQAYIMGSIKNPFKFSQELTKAFLNVLRNSEEYKKYKAMGGGFASPISANRKVLQETLSELIPSKYKGIKGRLQKAISMIEKLNDSLESMPRLAEYRSYIDRHGDTYENRLQAMYEATDVTLNFMKRGRITHSVIGQAIPFLNAGIQGLDKLYRAGFKDKEQFNSRLIRSLTAITMFNLIIAMAYKDDEDYEKLSNHIKDNFWLIKYDKGKFIRIPKPRELGFIFGTTFERAFRKVVNNDPKAFEDIYVTFKNNFIPSVRSIFHPFIDVWANKSWLGTPIVSEKYKYLPDKEQYDDKTSDISIVISKIMPNSLGLFSSPKNIDYLLRQYSGVFGQLLLPATTNGGGVGAITQGIKNKMTADVAYSNDYVNKFYEIKEMLQEDYNSMKKTGKKPNGYSDKQRKHFNRIGNSLSKLWKQISNIEKDKSLTEKVRKEKIRAIRLKILEITEREVNNFEKTSTK